MTFTTGLAVFPLTWVVDDLLGFSLVISDCDDHYFPLPDVKSLTVGLAGPLPSEMDEEFDKYEAPVEISCWKEGFDEHTARLYRDKHGDVVIDINARNSKPKVIPAVSLAGVVTSIQTVLDLVEAPVVAANAKKEEIRSEIAKLERKLAELDRKTENLVKTLLKEI
jgi:hypothetical protein